MASLRIWRSAAGRVYAGSALMIAKRTKSAAGGGTSVIADAFAREGLTPRAWSNGPHHRYSTHSHPYHKVLYCVRGSITFRLEDTGEAFELQPGDRLDIEPHTQHSAI